MAKFALCAVVKSKTLKDVSVKMGRRLGIIVNINPPPSFYLSLFSSFNFSSPMTSVCIYEALFVLT